MEENTVKKMALVLAISAELEAMKMCNIKNYMNDELFEYDCHSFFKKAEELRHLASCQLKPEEE